MHCCTASETLLPRARFESVPRGPLLHRPDEDAGRDLLEGDQPALAGGRRGRPGDERAVHDDELGDAGRGVDHQPHVLAEGDTGVAPGRRHVDRAAPGEERRSRAERDLVVESRLAREDRRIERVVLCDAPRMRRVLHRVPRRERRPGVVEEHPAVRPAGDLAGATATTTAAGDGEFRHLHAAAIDGDRTRLRERRRRTPRPVAHPGVGGDGVRAAAKAAEDDPGGVARAHDLVDSPNLAARRVLDDVDDLRLRRRLVPRANREPPGVRDAGHRDDHSHHEEREGLEGAPEQNLGLAGHTNPPLGSLPSTST